MALGFRTNGSPRTGTVSPPGDPTVWMDLDVFSLALYMYMYSDPRENTLIVNLNWFPHRLRNGPDWLGRKDHHPW
jgi:hypothetical protein